MLTTSLLAVATGKNAALVSLPSAGMTRFVAVTNVVQRDTPAATVNVTKPGDQVLVVVAVRVRRVKSAAKEGALLGMQLAATMGLAAHPILTAAVVAVAQMDSNALMAYVWTLA
ncbi:hypothetical protein TWF281_011247 [Arthrobotrys megalospora]